MKRFLVVGVVLMGWAAPGSLAAPPPTPQSRPALPTMAELQGEFDAKDYHGVLRDLARVLSIKGKAAAEYDHYDLLTLRAESLLRLKENTAAAGTFEQAAKEAANEDQRATAIAMQILSMRSGRLVQYTPQKTSPGQKHDPIDIVEPEKRKEALAALYGDELATVAPAMKAAKGATTLPPIAQAMKAFNAHNLRMLELATTGADKDSQKAIADLKGRAEDLISRVLEREAKRTEEIGASADETIHQTVFISRNDGRFDASDVYRRRGLSLSQSNELKAIIQDCAQLVTVVQGLAQATGDADKPLSGSSTLAEQANDLRIKADRILRADYSVR